MLVISIQWASRSWLGWQVLAHPSWLEGCILRRFASDCSCLFTASQIAPENRPNVAEPASAISLSDIAVYAYIRLSIAAIMSENIRAVAVSRCARRPIAGNDPKQQRCC